MWTWVRVFDDYDLNDVDTDLQFEDLHLLLKDLDKSSVTVPGILFSFGGL